MNLQEARKAALNKTVVRYDGREYIILSLTMFPDKNKKSGWCYSAELTTLDFRGSVAVPVEFVKRNV